jgi:Family of unknown function (DUF6460)
MSGNNIQRFIGGSPGAVLLKLALLSLLVGVLLAAFGLTPWGFFAFLRSTFRDLIGTGMEAVHRVAGYVIAGAIIVVPIWLLIRLLSKKSCRTRLFRTAPRRYSPFPRQPAARSSCGLAFSPLRRWIA